MEEKLTGVDCNTPQHQAKYEIDDDICQKSKEIINNNPIKKQILVHSLPPRRKFSIADYIREDEEYDTQQNEVFFWQKPNETS